MPSATLEASTPGVRADEPVARLGDRRGRRDWATTRTVSAAIDRVAVGGRGATRPSAFDTTFWVTTIDVALAEPDRRECVGEQRREIVAGLDLGNAPARA